MGITEASTVRSHPVMWDVTDNTWTAKTPWLRTKGWTMQISIRPETVTLDRPACKVGPCIWELGFLECSHHSLTKEHGSCLCK